MSRRSSSISSLEAVPGKLRNLVHAQKPEMRIHVDNQKRVYTTLDKIQGTVSIVPPVDTSFDDIEIEFVGTSRTFVERLTTAAAVSGRAEAFHQFLKLSQPGNYQHYPADGILRAGKTYTFPFVFVVPQQLLLRVCQHKVSHSVVRDSHLQLPPTLGDREIDEDGFADDMAPEMASIRYCVLAKIQRLKHADDGSCSRVTVSTKAKNLRVLPSYDEEPPLDVKAEDQAYCMRKEKAVRKGVLKGKAGTLITEAAQPQSFRLRANTDSTGEPTTTMATIMLRFDPADEDAQPPRLGSLSTKLKTNTFFASAARQNFPSKNASLADLTQGVHTESLAMAQRCVANVEWQKHDPRKPSSMPRRDSACSMTPPSVPEPSANYKGKTFYTARVLAPLSLPAHKTFVPTFHSCLVTRSYLLKLELSLPNAGLGGSIDLRVPVQVSCDPNNQGDVSPGRSGSIASDMIEDSTIDGGADDVLRPRTIRVPSEELIGRSFANNYRHASVPMDAPPDYTAFASPRAVPVY